MKQHLKIQLRLFMIFAMDIWTGTIFRFAKKQLAPADYNYVLSIEQEVKRTDTYENKLYNLAYASAQINRYVIMPNEIFSFWKAIGNPNIGYKPGRSIKNGRLKEELGGGLCQVSGIIYYISILSGLKILERHHHSIDIYTENTRFTPLGTDATVAYGYKDLRVQNVYPFPIQFQLFTVGEKFHIQLMSTREIEKKALSFRGKHDSSIKIVEVRDEKENVIGISRYG